MYKIIIQLLLVSLIVYVFCLVASAEERLEYGYYVSGGHKRPEVPRISAFEVRKLYDQGKLLLVNPMTEKRNLLGAIFIPTEKIKNMAITFPQNLIVVFYCS